MVAICWDAHFLSIAHRFASMFCFLRMFARRAVSWGLLRPCPLLTYTARWSWMRAGSAPRAPRWAGRRPPRPPALGVSHQTDASAHAFGMPRAASFVASLVLSVSMYVRRLA